jgi:hypothetical protein
MIIGKNESAEILAGVACLTKIRSSLLPNYNVAAKHF